MAEVFLAEDLKHARAVAIKVLKPEIGSAVGAARFLSEIRVTAQLRHPNILPLYASGERAGFLFYVLPYVEGETLGERLTREGPMKADEAVRLVSQLAGALDYAHERGLVHRDIKPGNIMLERGQAVLTDFGIARQDAQLFGENGAWFRWLARLILGDEAEAVLWFDLAFEQRDPMLVLLPIHCSGSRARPPATGRRPSEREPGSEGRPGGSRTRGRGGCR